MTQATATEQRTIPDIIHEVVNQTLEFIHELEKLATAANSGGDRDFMIAYYAKEQAVESIRSATNGMHTAWRKVLSTRYGPPDEDGADPNQMTLPLLEGGSIMGGDDSLRDFPSAPDGPARVAEARRSRASRQEQEG